MDRIDAGNRREPGGPGGRRSGAGGRGPGCCALDMAHGLSGFFCGVLVFSWYLSGIVFVCFWRSGFFLVFDWSVVFFESILER